MLVIYCIIYESMDKSEAIEVINLLNLSFVEVAFFLNIELIILNNNKKTQTKKMEVSIFEKVDLFLNRSDYKRDTMEDVVNVQWYLGFEIKPKLVFHILSNLCLLFKRNYTPDLFVLDKRSLNGKKITIIQDILESLWDVSLISLFCFVLYSVRLYIQTFSYSYRRRSPFI